MRLTDQDGKPLDSKGKSSESPLASGGIASGMPEGKLQPQRRSAIGRKTKQDSRANELCLALVAWRRKDQSVRPSIRALARRLSTSHELLRYYLARLEKRKYKEVSRVAEEEAVVIRNRAKAENRELTGSELQQLQTLDVRSFRALLGVAALDSLDRLKQAASRGPMHRLEYRMLEVLVKSGVPGALELWEKRVEIGLKPKKIFAAIVKDTPRQEGESAVAWARRIWDECENYETNCPTEINEQLLEKYARGVDKKHKGNLPEATPENAKSFKSVGGEAGNSAKVEGRRNDAGII